MSKVPIDLSNTPSFIETQFPVAKLSMESYKERTAKQGQTLTGLGKWWGRKPLVLVRASILGLLLPSTDDPEKDMQVFLQLMTMDTEGLWRRKKGNITGQRLLQELTSLPSSIQKRFLSYNEAGEPMINLPRGAREEKEELHRMVFERMTYAEKLNYCYRPEEIEGPSKETWKNINAHLGTNAHSLSELVVELGERRFGHRPRVGDAFCGGGSIPFEAARLGCDAYGSDLNPVAALLTWAGLNIVGGGEDTTKHVQKIQKAVYEGVERQIMGWGIEHNSLGWRADAYLYCVEVVDPESGWKIPLIPTLVVSDQINAIARLIPDEKNKRYDIEIVENVSDNEMRLARQSGTIKDSRLIPPDGHPTTPLEVIRRNLRLWEKQDIVPRPDDVFQERLYCIRWIEICSDEKRNQQTCKHFRAPTADDLEREIRVLELLQECFFEWQEMGYLPSLKIEPGAKTDEPIRTRGWTYWHHLFMPRQLLLLGLIAQQANQHKKQAADFCLNLLGLSRSTDYNSKLCRWHTRTIGDKSEQTFSNQALNTLYNFAVRPSASTESSFIVNLKSAEVIGKAHVDVCDARRISISNDIWITDPPYADAINYHELSEYFLAWYDKQLTRLFPNWYIDSKRSLAVQGNNIDFRRSMVDCYRRIADFMPKNGQQIVMFTHQDAAVWADLTLILWAAGLRVTAAWTIATETDSAMKQGNYVQGTVLLVLRKRIETEPVFIDEIHYQVEEEVRRQLDLMTRLDDDSDPNFGDADYQLAAYAAALRVLTAQPIYEINPEREILRERSSSEVGPVEALIRDAVKIACDHLVPRNLDGDLWRQLGAMERFYLKGLEVESHGEYRNGVYQELARGFGATDYTDLLANTQANETRLKTARELGRRMLSGEGFPTSLVRHCLHAIYLTSQEDETQAGLDWLHTELTHSYWPQRQKIIHLLDYLARLRYHRDMPHWEKDTQAAHLLAGAVRNDHA